MDGLLTFFDGEKADRPQRVLVQVKSGKVKSGDIRDLAGTVEREGAAQGIFITLEPPTRDMITEALSAGEYDSPLWGKRYPRLQIMTLEQLLADEKPNTPPRRHPFKRAERVKDELPQTRPLFDLE
ncbi:MAG: restriction endonuclease [Anaerolineae bacterium]|nr:restriction endonuclease [Anaerolineae bacterium]